MFGRLVHKVDFERVLAMPSRTRSAHFAVHHLAGRPQTRAAARRQAAAAKLSTGPAPECPQPVDDSPGGVWLGCVVPKRHARRAVTRNLLRRQIRGAFDRRATELPAGLWLVRLRAPFSTVTFVSARSAALAAAARAELDGLLGRIVA